MVYLIMIGPLLLLLLLLMTQFVLVVSGQIQTQFLGRRLEVIPRLFLASLSIEDERSLSAPVLITSVVGSSLTARPISCKNSIASASLLLSYTIGGASCCLASSMTTLVGIPASSQSSARLSMASSSSSWRLCQAILLSCILISCLRLALCTPRNSRDSSDAGSNCARRTKSRSTHIPPASEIRMPSDDARSCNCLCVPGSSST